MALTKKNLTKIKKLKVVIQKEKQKLDNSKPKEEDKKKKVEEQQTEEKKEEQQEPKFSDFKETILEQDIGFAAPVISEEEKTSNNLESLGLDQSRNSLEDTTSGVFLPNATTQNGLYSPTNNLYGGSNNGGNYDGSSRYESESLFPSTNTNEHNALARQSLQDDSIIRRNTNAGWGSERKELENFSRLQEQYRSDREQQAKKARQ